MSDDQVFPGGNRPIIRNCASCRDKTSGQKAIGIWNFSRGPREIFSSLSSKIRNDLLTPIKINKLWRIYFIFNLPDEIDKSHLIGWLAGFWKSTFVVELTPISVFIITGDCCFWGFVPTPLTVYFKIPS